MTRFPPRKKKRAHLQALQDTLQVSRCEGGRVSLEDGNEAEKGREGQVR